MRPFSNHSILSSFPEDIGGLGAGTELTLEKMSISLAGLLRFPTHVWEGIIDQVLSVMSGLYRSRQEVGNSSACVHTVRRRWAGDNFESSLENAIVLFFSAVSLPIPHTLKKKWPLAIRAIEWFLCPIPRICLAYVRKLKSKWTKDQERLNMAGHNGHPLLWTESSVVKSEGWNAGHRLSVSSLKQRLCRCWRTEWGIAQHNHWVLGLESWRDSGIFGLSDVLLPTRVYQVLSLR